MLPEIARALAPLQDAVHAAEAALDAHNRNPAAKPLDGLHLAGHLIHAHQTLNARMRDLLDALGTGDTHETRMRIHGRIRALEEENAHD